ncbi:uncharacterized protein LOC113794284 isoform X2 [Dermatophagoides pteronyssinus]|uniref:uncharacterized protein LOC113794284 isoform X2 n=1 Tax=Dermatophagoides pteronyssinus TaxID=6956 RepID=UPI003F664D3D
MTTVLNNHSDDKQQEKLEKCKKLLSLRSAPLASFEDLPTDEQNSSTSHSSDDDDNEEKHQQQQRPESSSSGQQTLQSSSQITVLITDHDDDGSGGDRIHSAAASIINDDGASSLSPKLPKANQRKGSWTDIFFGRKSPTIIPTKERKFSLLSFKFSFKDDNKQQQQCELTPMTVIDSRRKTPSPPVIIDCGIQLTPTNHSNIDDLFSITTTTSNNTIVFIHENPEGSSSIIESKTELPITKQQPSQESDCDSLCSLCQHNDDKLPSFYHENNTTDDQTECSECEICCENDRIANNNNESTDMDMIADYEDNNDDDDDKQINNNNDNHLKLDSSYDSYELEMLVKNDELDLNRKFHYHHSNDDYKIKEFNDTSPNNRRPSLGKNLEENFQSKKLPTLSIERPHSIVPVTNIEKFEAYLDKFSIKNNNEIEMKTDDSSKLKIILPDITKSSRYSRKSNPFIWLQFCEQGLKSPKILRKRAKSCFPSLTPQQFFFNSFTDLTNNDNDDDLKASSPGNLTPITPLKNLDMVDGDDIFRNDHFEPKINFKKSKMKNQSMNSECTCSCATTTTTTTPLTSPTITMTTNNLVSLTTATTIDSETNICLEMTSEDESMIEQSDRSKKNSTMVELIGEDQPLLVSPCDCICHHHQIISSSTTKKEFATKIKIQDKKKNVESKNVEKQMTSDEITSSDLCLISSSSSTTLSSSSTSSSSSSTSSSVSSPSSSISPSSSST